MLKRLIEIKEHTNKADLTIGQLYDIIEDRFLDDKSDRRPAEFFEWQAAPNPPLPHADIRKAAADGWPVEIKTNSGEWHYTTQPRYFREDEYRVVAPTKTTTQVRLEEIETEINILLAESLELKDE